jgi:hypothetical protein
MVSDKSWRNDECPALGDSWEAIRAFAGDDPSKAIFYPEDDRYLVDRELTVSHYVIFESS